MLIRPATPADVPAMTAILNAIIAIGGTTAHEHAKTPDDVRTDYIDGLYVISSVVAEVEGQIIGWQSVEFWEGDPHIGTFVRPGLQARGTGTGLFAATQTQVRAAALGYIIATIRADNVPGLAYYARIGFRDIAYDPDFTLQTGQKVGRITRRFDLD